MNYKKFFKPLSIVVYILILCLWCLPAGSDDSNDVSELKEQIKSLQKRVDELEVQKNESPQEAEDYYPDRYRHEWNPFEEMDRMQREMDRMFRSSFGHSGEPQGAFSSNMSFDYDFDVKETEEGYEIKFDMKGLDKEKVDIQINQHSLTVKGERSEEQKEKGDNSYYSSKSYGSFMKTLPLPLDADTSKVKTEKKGNMLIINIPKKS